ncbi:MAG TPA: HD-GYP domain-containing protein, partial [Syntrophomonadaceae bacterium]|nr:HD-GYP domain-containing protein [Syntrophomonadaceae bacterium]
MYMDDLEPGMVIARTVVGLDGRSLLTENTRLTPSYIQRMQNMNIRSIYIKDGLTDIEVPEIVSERVLLAVSKTLSESVKALSNRKLMNIGSIKKSVALLVEDIMSNRHLLIQLEDIRTFDDYLFMHSINVAIFSIMTGLTMGYPESKLMDLGLGALLHDIGMTMIDQSVLNKTTPLTPEENELIMTHPEVGFNILRTYREVSTTSAHIAYQHHERMSGTGYPRRLDGKQILEYARIVTVVDTFDAVISDRPFRNGYSVNEAMTILTKLSDNYFDPQVLEAFTTNVAVYPVGTLLMLNTGHLAVVTSVSKTNASQPVVHVISDQQGNFV